MPKLKTSFSSRRQSPLQQVAAERNWRRLQIKGLEAIGGNLIRAVGGSIYSRVRFDQLLKQLTNGLFYNNDEYWIEQKHKLKLKEKADAKARP